jgi:hypothetical protein
VWINCKVVGKYNEVIYWPHCTHTESQEMPNRSGAVALTFIVLNRARPLEQVYWSSDVNFISLYNFRSKRSSLRQLASYIKDNRQTPCNSSRCLRYCHLASIKQERIANFLKNCHYQISWKSVLRFSDCYVQTDRLDETIMQCAFLLRLRRKQTLAWVANLKRKLTD